MRTAPLYHELVATNEHLSRSLYGVDANGKLVLDVPKQHRFVVVQGGGDAGKTVTILQILATVAKSQPGSIILVAGISMPNLRNGALRAYDKYVKQDFEHDLSWFNKTDKIQYFRNGSQIHFKSYANESDVRGSEWDYAFFNEANLFNYELFWQTQRKVRKQFFLDYNPTAKFWSHTMIMEGGEKGFIGKAIYFQVDHRHNPFLTQEQHEAYESISDPEKFKVYARGETGKVKGLVYKNYKLIDSIPKGVRTHYGLDFGYTHPMALVKVGVYENKMYWHEVIHESGMTIADLIKRMKQLHIDKSTPIYCDHARPDMIADLRKAGFNAIEANKAVVEGIDYVNRHELHITKTSENLIKEANGYKWMVHHEDSTKDAKKEAPVKFKDDGMDAGRYGAMGFNKENWAGSSGSEEKKRTFLDHVKPVTLPDYPTNMWSKEERKTSIVEDDEYFDYN